MLSGVGWACTLHIPALGYATGVLTIYLTIMYHCFLFTVQNQWTPLHVAAKHGIDTIESLITRGSDANAVTMVSCFVLMILIIMFLLSF